MRCKRASAWGLRSSQESPRPAHKVPGKAWGSTYCNRISGPRLPTREPFLLPPADHHPRVSRMSLLHPRKREKAKSNLLTVSTCGQRDGAKTRGPQWGPGGRCLSDPFFALAADQKKSMLAGGWWVDVIAATPCHPSPLQPSALGLSIG